MIFSKCFEFSSDSYISSIRQLPRKSIKYFSQGSINLLAWFKTANRTASIKRAGRGKDDEEGDDDDDDDDVDDDDDTEDCDDDDDDDDGDGEEEIEDS